MGLITKDSNPLNRRAGQCFQEAAQIIEDNKDIQITDLWAMVACFQVALRQIIENQKRNPNKSLEEILQKQGGL